MTETSDNDNSDTEHWDLYECTECGDTFPSRRGSHVGGYECFACGASAGCFELVERDVRTGSDQ